MDDLEESLEADLFLSRPLSRLKDVLQTVKLQPLFYIRKEVLARLSSFQVFAKAYDPSKQDLESFFGVMIIFSILSRPLP